jgi:hypothetical protein
LNFKNSDGAYYNIRLGKIKLIYVKYEHTVVCNLCLLGKNQTKPSRRKPVYQNTHYLQCKQFSRNKAQDINNPLIMESEKFCLRWNDFETSISRAFKELREDKDFFDVTLVCDDSQIDAHKVILSACSPFFRTILIRNPHQHPLLYLKGVKHSELLAVLNFMYMGEVNVAQEELNSFLSVAEELKVKGLTQGNSGPKSSNENTVNHTKKELNKRDKSMKSQVQNPTRRQIYQKDDSCYEIQEYIPVKTEPNEPPITQPEYTATQEYSTQENQAEPILVQQTVMLADSYQADEVEAYDYQYEEGYGDMSAAGFEPNSSSGKQWL